MSSRFAAKTTVPVERSRVELERTLTRYGCDSFASGWSQKDAMVQFGYKGRHIRIVVPYPKDDDFERAQRQRWRVLLLLVKAQVEAVECGLMKFEEAFLPWMVLKDGSTVLETMLPQLPAEASAPKLKEIGR